jgi:hypothetical protein
MAPLRGAAGVVVLVLTLALIAVAGGPAQARKAKPTVGTVTAVSGTKKLSRAGGVRLKVGAKLTLGERIVLGKGVSATLRLLRPKGVASDVDLVKLDPVDGAKEDVRVARDGRYIVVTISPA